MVVFFVGCLVLGIFVGGMVVGTLFGGLGLEQPAVMLTSSNTVSD